jgi:hypothetical protein
VELTGHGLRATMPPGWEGAIALERGSEGIELAAAGGVLRPVAHLATFPLPGDRGDFGSGAVELMRTEDVFVALLEYDPAEAGSALFARRGIPPRLDPRRFSAVSLQRGLPEQAGLQEFFTEAGRPFCLYVVLGDRNDAHLQVRKVEQVLAGVRIDPLPATAERSTGTP